MSVKSLVRNLTQNQDESVMDDVLNKNFAMLEDVLNQEINELQKFSPYNLNLKDNDLENLEKLIDSFIIPSYQRKKYSQAMHFLKKYR